MAGKPRRPMMSREIGMVVEGSGYTTEEFAKLAGILASRLQTLIKGAETASVDEEARIRAVEPKK